MTRTFRYISNQDVKDLLTPAGANAVAEQTLLDHHAGDIQWASPRQLDLIPEATGTQFKVKGCILRKPGVAGFRVVGLNRTKGGHAIMAERPTKNVLLFDASTAELFGIVDERWAYALRTGACGAIALKHLAAPGAEDAAIVGTGHMAYGGLVTLAATMPLKRVRVWSPNKERRTSFAKRMSNELDIEVVAVDSAEACVHGAELIMTATNAREPFLSLDSIAPRATVYAMGGFQELTSDAYRKMSYFVDDRAQVLILTDIQELIRQYGYSDDWVEADLAEVVGGAHPGRRSQDERILIRSQGLATQDVAQAYWLYQQAEAIDGGVRLEDVLMERAGSPLF